MWQVGWREHVWSSIEGPWDIVVIGGGITGAGVLSLASHMGLSALLLEKSDFASGTSSASGKMVHGGLRYLKQGQVRLTWYSVRERERLIAEGRGLVDPMGFLLATYKGDRPGSAMYKAGLVLYDMMAGRCTHKYYPVSEFLQLAPHVRSAGLLGGFRYVDARTDDSRLVLRVIREAVRRGAAALNYAMVEELTKTASGQVDGVVVRNVVSHETARVKAAVVVNAAGAWADGIREQVGRRPRLRPLRGSHLLFPSWRVPVAQAMTFLHPADRRPLYVLPWENATLLGTTDVFHDRSPDDCRISAREFDYLMDAATYLFDRLDLTPEDVICTFSGVRPVVGTGKLDSSRESREHVVFKESGLVTATGGKLTTFRLLAADAMAATGMLPRTKTTRAQVRALDEVNAFSDAPDRLLGRYGSDAGRVLECAREGELSEIPGTPYLWAELRWAARAEGVVRLEDLLMRRLRLGLLLPSGGADLLPRIRAVVQPELGWSDERWEIEATAYQKCWRSNHAPDLSGTKGG